MAGLGRTAGLDTEQLGSGIAGLFGGFLAHLAPPVIAEGVQGGRLGFGSGVTMNEVERTDRHIKLVSARILQAQELHLLVADG